MTNCVNCGAVLHGDVCEYCGTQYKNGVISATFEDRSECGEITIHGKSFNVYLSRVDISSIGGNAFRSVDGRLHRCNPITKHKFTMIEM